MTTITECPAAPAVRGKRPFAWLAVWHARGPDGSGLTEVPAGLRRDVGLDDGRPATRSGDGRHARIDPDRPAIPPIWTW